MSLVLLTAYSCQFNSSNKADIPEVFVKQWDHSDLLPMTAAFLMQHLIEVSHDLPRAASQSSESLGSE